MINNPEIIQQNEEIIQLGMQEPSPKTGTLQHKTLKSLTYKNFVKRVQELMFLQEEDGLEITHKTIISDPTSRVRTRCATQNECFYLSILSHIEPRQIDETLQDSCLIEFMQVELNQFERSKVWRLLPRLKDHPIISTKQVFRNKVDEEGVITRNKVRLVAKGYLQEFFFTMIRPLNQWPHLKL